MPQLQAPVWGAADSHTHKAQKEACQETDQTPQPVVCMGGGSQVTMPRKFPRWKTEYIVAKQSYKLGNGQSDRTET